MNRDLMLVVYAAVLGWCVCEWWREEREEQERRMRVIAYDVVDLQMELHAKYGHAASDSGATAST
jgi:hypothetical protein